MQVYFVHRASKGKGSLNMLRCQACRRPIRPEWGSFPCRCCGQKLRWDLGLSLVEYSLLGFTILLFPFVLAFWLWSTVYSL